MDDLGRIARLKARRAATLDFAVQIALVALLAYWTMILVKPFLTIVIWSVILAVVLNPLFVWMVSRLHMHRALAALLVTILCLVVLLGPTAWLGISLVETLRSVALRLGSGSIAVPLPPEALKNWPLIGDKIFGFWSLASTDLKAALVQIGPQLTPIENALLGLAGSAGMSMIKFVIATVISGFLLPSGPMLVKSGRLIFRRYAADRGDEFVDLIGTTIRNLARGVLGVSILQSLLAGIGFILAGIPAAGFFTVMILLLGIVQVDAAIVTVPLIIWSWIKMNTTVALIFTVYMIPVTLLNNILRPFVIAHGLKTPMLVIFIGIIGGILAHGLIGLFVGPVVLAVAWELLSAWIRRVTSEQTA